MSNPATKRALSPTVLQVMLGKPIEIDTPRVFVNPPIAHLCDATPPQSIRWDNQTGGPVMIWLPNGDKLLNPPSGKDFSKPFLIAPNCDLTLGVKKNPKKARIQYHVYCEVIGDYAEGNSPPVLSCP